MALGVDCDVVVFEGVDEGFFEERGGDVASLVAAFVGACAGGRLVGGWDGGGRRT